MTYMFDTDRISSAALKRYVGRGDVSKIKPEWLGKVTRILGALHAAVSPEELDMPGFGFHRLTTPRKGTYAVWISRNWRITFKWDDAGPYDLDMEDYHGR